MSLFAADPFPLLLQLPWDQIKESGNAVEKEIDGLGATKGGRDGRKGHAFDRRPPAFLDLSF